MKKPEQNSFISFFICNEHACFDCHAFSSTYILTEGGVGNCQKGPTQQEQKKTDTQSEPFPNVSQKTPAPPKVSKKYCLKCPSPT